MKSNIIHCPHGPHRKACWPTFEKMSSSLGSGNYPFPNVTFITYNNRNEECIAEKSFARFNFKNWIVLAKNCKKWTWMCKVTPVIEYLNNDCRTEYVCAIDGDDCVVLNPEGLLEKFKKYGCEMLFGNTPVDYPPNQECKLFEESVYHGKKRHLNAIYVGKTETVLKILIEIERAGKEGLIWTKGVERTFHDQMTLRHMHKKYYPRLMVDYRQEIFARIDELFLNSYKKTPML